MPPRATSPRPAALGVLLAPGASAGRDQPALVAIDRALAPKGMAVARMDFPYRKAGRRAPDREPVLVEAVRAEAESLSRAAGLPGDHLVLGGRSMGGRMCSIAVAGGLPAAGLVLVSYPLHPPGRADKMRTAHFTHLTVPCLFVSGTKDAFGTREELEAATKAIPGPVTHVWLEGKDHGLRGADDDVVTAVSSWLEPLSVMLGKGRRPRG